MSSPSSSKWTLRVCLLACVLSCSVSNGPQVITVKSEDDVVLPCHSPRGANVVRIRWMRPDLKSKLYVFFFREHRVFKKYQHQSFHGRVELTDPQMQGGDVSVVLKNITIKDTGTYECHVTVTGNSSEFISIIHLQVKDHHQITVTTGHDVILQCLDPRGGDIELLEWKRLDQEEDVCVCRRGNNNCNTSHESFKERVKLRDPEMKDGNVSVILRNVNIKDTGTYECYVENNNTEFLLITNITLTVTDSGDGAGDAEDGRDKGGGNKDERLGLIGSLSIISLLIIIAVVCLLCVYKGRSKFNESPACELQQLNS